VDTLKRWTSEMQNASQLSFEEKDHNLLNLKITINGMSCGDGNTRRFGTLSPAT